MARTSALFLLALAGCPETEPTERSAPAQAPAAAGDQALATGTSTASADATGGATPTASPGTAPASHRVSDRSQQLNTEGYRAYRAGDLDEAARLFRAAVAEDGLNPLAHYNLACTLALLRRQGRSCDVDATLATILEHLARAVALDEGRRSRMRQDADLDDLRNTLRYRLLDRGVPASDADRATLLGGVTLWGPPLGVWGASAVIQLRLDGSVGVSRREERDGAMVEEPARDGRWRTGEGRLWLDLGQGEQALDLDEQGRLTPVGSEPAGWSGHPPECGA